MADPVEVIARAIDPAAWSELGRELPEAASRRGDAIVIARAALSALEAKGMVVISRTPTPAMEVAGAQRIADLQGWCSRIAAESCWRAMITARPSAECKVRPTQLEESD